MHWNVMDAAEIVALPCHPAGKTKFNNISTAALALVGLTKPAPRPLP